MIVSDKMKIFISDKIKNGSKLYKAIEQSICKDIQCNNCQIIRNKEFFKAHKDNYSKVRFGCVTPKTEKLYIDKLLAYAIPTVLFGPDDNNHYEILLESHGVFKELLNEMIYNTKHKREISGAIRWVHNYYYYLSEKKEKEVKKMKEMRKKILDEAREEVQSRRNP